jgi:hypothetical protein
MESTFAIFGSCVTRDAFEICKKVEDGRNVCIYLTRTTINSCLSTPVIAIKDPFEPQGKLNFEERCVFQDLFKLHFDRLQEGAFDYLVLDLIDERHAIAAVNGSYLCVSSPFMKMAKTFNIDVSQFEYYSPLEQWIIQKTLDNIPLFLKRLCSIVDHKRIILHEALWATRFVSADGTLRGFPNQVEIRKVNDVFERYYACIKSTIPLQSIRLPEDVRIGDETNKWALEPFHYVRDYYGSFMTKLDYLTA